MVIKPTQISARKSRLCHKDCYCLVTQLCLTLWDPMEYSPSGQVPLSMGFSRQEYWSELSFPSPGDLSDPEIELAFPALPGKINTVLSGALAESVTGASPEPGCCTASLTQRPLSAWGALAFPWGGPLYALCPWPSPQLALTPHHSFLWVPVVVTDSPHHVLSPWSLILAASIQFLNASSQDKKSDWSCWLYQPKHRGCQMLAGLW